MPASDELLRKLVETISELSARVRHLEVVESGMSPHASRHQDGGSDEINVKGLSGKLADAQDAGWLRAKEVSTTAPATDDVLAWNGSKWTPTALTIDAMKAGVKRASDNLHLTNNWQDVPGCTKTLTFAADEYLLVWAIFDFEMEYTSQTNDLLGALNVAGTNQAPQAFYENDAPGGRATVAQVWIVSPGSGKKTFKLQAKRTSNGTGSWCYATHTSMLWMRGGFTDES